jgi:hypothetical protein
MEAPAYILVISLMASLSNLNEHSISWQDPNGHKANSKLYDGFEQTLIGL